MREAINTHLKHPPTHTDGRLCQRRCCLWQNYTINSRRFYRFWIVCVRVRMERDVNPSPPSFSISPSFHPSLFSWAAAVDSFNGKFKHTTPPLCRSLHLISTLSPFFFCPLSLSLYLSFCLPPSHLPKHHKAFSPFCFAVGVADQYHGKARERGRARDWGKGKRDGKRKEREEKGGEARWQVDLFDSLPTFIRLSPFTPHPFSLSRPSQPLRPLKRGG